MSVICSRSKRQRHTDPREIPVPTLPGGILSSPGPSSRFFALATPISLVLSEDKIQFLGAGGGGRVVPGLPTSTE